MIRRRRPEVISARVTPEEKRHVELVAATGGKSVSELVWERTVPWCRDQLVKRLLEPRDEGITEA